MVGIKGVGMTGLAQILRAQGKEVWGSDTAEHFFTEEVLRKNGIEYIEGFDAKHLERIPDLVIRSTAYGDSNIEIVTAQAKKIPIATYAEVLGELSAVAKSLAVTGSHGKTTTSALLAHVLKVAGLSPQALIGSRVPQFEGNALTGSGELFVFEADEYQNKLQYFSPHAVILTSIAWDHPDFFPDPQSYRSAFVEFLKKIPPDGFVVACYDDAEVKQAIEASGLKPEQIESYGLTNGVYHMVRMWLDEARWHFSCSFGEEYLGDFKMRLVGSHNVANALAVLACARRLGVDVEAIRQAFATFEGTARRFEIKGKLTNGVTVVDDYGHHPQEIAATLKAARAFYPYKNIRCIFQPHTFSRTAALLTEFGKSFQEADEVVIIDTYSSARESAGQVTSKQLADEISKHHKRVIYRPGLVEAENYLAESAGRSDLVLTMGAGDVWQIGDALVKRFGTVESRETR